MTTLPNTELNKPFPSDGLAWLLEAAIDQTPTATVLVRLATALQPITYQSKTYEPYPFSVGPWSDDSSGRRDTIEITLSNQSLEAGRWVAEGRGFRDMPFTLLLIQKELLTEDPVIELRGYIDAPLVTEAAVSLPVRQSRANDRSWPWMRFVPSCHAVYQDPATCGYDGSLPTCAKTLTACVEHGDDEAANDRPVIHPQRFHGFPGIPRERR